MIEFSEKGRSTILAGQWETWWCGYWWGEPPFCGWCTLWGTITYITPTPNIRRLIVLRSYSHPWGYHSLLNFWQISHSPLPIAGVVNQEGDQWLLQTNPRNVSNWGHIWYVSIVKRNDLTFICIWFTFPSNTLSSIGVGGVRHMCLNPGSSTICVI